MPTTVFKTKKIANPNPGITPAKPSEPNWTPVAGGVSIGVAVAPKRAGVKIRGTGAATKGTLARGPMA